MPISTDIGPIDSLLNRSIVRGWIPGAVVYIGRGDKTVCRKAYGNRMHSPRVDAAEVDTIFDLASLTKPVACATSIMLLAERGTVSLTDRVASYIPEFALGGKSGTTIEHLLLHTGGLPSENPLEDYNDGLALALSRIIQVPQAHEPGTRFQYSDLGYVVLGQVVNVLDSRGLAGFAHDEIFAPLCMVDTLFTPPARLARRCAASSLREGRWVTSEVHDPRAYRLGGVSGHAGLFSTADDLAAFCRLILNRGTHAGRRILAESTVDAMTKPECLPAGAGLRTYVFDVATQFSAAWAENFAIGDVLGHTGFTGTMLCICPRQNWFVVLLTNAVHAPVSGHIAGVRLELMAHVADIISATQ